MGDREKGGKEGFRQTGRKGERLKVQVVNTASAARSPLSGGLASLLPSVVFQKARGAASETVCPTAHCESMP